MSHQMILKRWLISGLGKEMLKIIWESWKTRKLREFKDQWGLNRKFRNPNEKTKHLPDCWEEWCFCFSTHFMFVIAFLPRSKCLLISWLQAASTVILQAIYKTDEEICHFFHVFSFYLPWRMGLDSMILVFYLIFNFRLAQCVQMLIGNI